MLCLFTMNTALNHADFFRFEGAPESNAFMNEADCVCVRVRASECVQEVFVGQHANSQ